MPIAFKLPRLYPILDTLALAEKECSTTHAAEGLLESGVRILQYRHKGDWTQSRFDDAKQIAKLCHAAGVLFVLNDRADFARLLGAALHVGQEDLPPAAARRVISDEVMGFSTHNKMQLERGDKEPVEYLSIGPIFSTGSKLRPDPVVGVEGLRQLRPLTEKPLVAIGGITLLNAKNVLAAGADSVAVISGLMPDKCNRKTVRRISEDWLQVLTASTA
jgi:thiamine-phosphate pyrophosphorylase